VRIKLGAFELETSGHATVATPAPSVQQASTELLETSSDILKVARPAGASVTSLADRASAAAKNPDGMQADITSAPALGIRPNVGDLAVVDARAQAIAAGPMRWNVPYAYNQSWTPRRNARTPFQVLRSFGDVDDISRICIETRKDQMCSLNWDIVSREIDQRRKSVDDRVKGRIDKVKAFFQKPDKRRSFYTYLRAMIEDILVIDALAIYKRRQNNGQLHALELKDGATFVCQIDETGDTPLPPQVAYRQVIFGQYLEGADCSTDDLLYRPRCVRTHTPYGLSPIEAILLAVNQATQRSVFNLAYYTDGNIPEGIIDAPQDWSPEQIKEAEQFLNDALSGNLGARRKLRLVGKGTAASLKQFKEPDFTGDFDKWLLNVRCAAFAVPPSEIGFVEDVNKSNGKNQENVVYRRGVKPLTNFIQDIFDEVIANDLDCPDLRFSFAGGEAEDILARARADEVYVRIGKTSVDELRLRDGQDQIGLGNYIASASGPILVAELLDPNAEIDDDPTTTEVPEVEPDGTASSSKPKPGADDGQGEGEAIAAELAKWRSVAIKRCKGGKEQKLWTSDVLPELLGREVHGAIAKASTVAEIVGIFDAATSGVVKARTTTRKIRKIEKQIHAHATRHFLKMGAAVVKHLEPAVESLPKEAV
jgi:hypothetical protein